MQESTIYSEYKTYPNNKMRARTSCKASSMKKENPSIKIIIEFPETSDESNCIIDEARTILLDIFQNNMKAHLTTKETTHESSTNR